MKFDEPPLLGAPKLYRVEFEGGFRHIEASSFGRALFAWRQCMMLEFGSDPDSGWDLKSEPDSITLVDHEPVFIDLPEAEIPIPAEVAP